MVVLTDARRGGPSNEADKARDEGTIIFAVGVGKRERERETRI